jgi:rare lipoprotein A
MSSMTRQIKTRAQRRARLLVAARRSATLTIAILITLLVTGCHHHPQQAYQPPPPPIYPTHRTTRQGTAENHPAPVPRGPIAEPEGKPTLIETGLASWYGPSGHRSADGSAYDGKSMTAAHKTLPLGTTVRVTNLVNGESVMVRITDRGPFAHGRVLDLSESAAKQIDLYRMGVAKVKIEAFPNPTASLTGRWCVQTGAFKSEQDAIDLKSALLKRYAGSRVTEFPGATGYWVRIDPARHDHAEAVAIHDWIGNPDPQAVPYIVRVD